MEMKIWYFDKPIMEPTTCPTCDNYDFNINRADQFMVSKKSVGTFYNIGPEDLWKLIEAGLEQGFLIGFGLVMTKNLLKLVLKGRSNGDRGQTLVR